MFLQGKPRPIQSTRAQMCYSRAAARTAQPTDFLAGSPRCTPRRMTGDSGLSGTGSRHPLAATRDQAEPQPHPRASSRRPVGRRLSPLECYLLRVAGCEGAPLAPTPGQEKGATKRARWPQEGLRGREVVLPDRESFWSRLESNLSLPAGRTIETVAAPGSKPCAAGNPTNQ